MEKLCDCRFSSEILNHLSLQCFPDSSAKIDVRFELKAPPTRNISQMVTLLKQWVANHHQIVLDDSNTTARIDTDCDITVVQGSVCTSTEAPISIPGSTSQSALATGESRTEGLIAGVVVAGIVIITLLVVLVVVVLWMRHQVIR